MLKQKMLVPKFHLGQKVVTVHRVQDTTEEHVECEYCDSTGKIELKAAGNDSQFFKCPACNGRMRTIRNGEKYEIWRKNLTIGKVQVEMYAPKYKNRCESGVSYMLDESGVAGGGSIWPEYMLFATEDDANEFCEKYIPEEHFNKPVLKEKYKNGKEWEL